MSHENLLDGPAPTLLPADGPDADARAALTQRARRRARPCPPRRRRRCCGRCWPSTRSPTTATRSPPTPTPAPGYHRGLDALRRAGWHGRGPIPADHAPNQGFLRALLALAEAAEAIGESEEADALRDSSSLDCGTSVDEVASLR